MEVRYTFKSIILSLIGCLFYALPIHIHAQNIQVTNPSNAGVGSLRAAINVANSNPNPDTISFVFSVAPFTIKPTTPLPILTDNNTVIDATLGGHNPGDVELEGSPGILDGLVIQGNNCEIYGMYFYNFQESGIEINGASYTLIGQDGKHNYFTENSLEGILVKNAYDTDIKFNYLGTNPTLSFNIGNNKGLVLDNSNAVHIYNNIIVQNNLSGISIKNCDDIEIKENNIGVNDDDITAMKNFGDGIYIYNNSSDIEIGGSPSDYNIIAFNNGAGVSINNGADSCDISKNKMYCNNTGIQLAVGTNQDITSPYIFTATSSLISGTSTPNAKIEIFIKNESNCLGAACQGFDYQGTTTADISGNWSFSGVFNPSEQVTATATLNSNTSEFSSCLSVAAGCNLTDSLALVDLYNATNGASWTIPWNLTQPIYTWYGVYFNPFGCVDSLILISNNLSGNIPNLNLSELRHLLLDSNALSGNIPNFDKMPNLKHISLMANNFNGTMPNFSNCYNLETINLSDNNLSGTVPDLSALYFLQLLDLHHNQFIEIHDFYSNYNLHTLNVADNQLVGTIPNFGAYSLETIKLNDNQLSDTVPNFYLPNLKNLHLQDNDIRVVSDFSNIPFLEKLFLQNNLIEDLPSFTNLPNLQIMDVKKNQLTFEDILPNLTIPNTHFIYAPQDSVGIENTVNLTSCNTYTIDLDIDDTVNTSQYFWSQNGIRIDSSNINQYYFPSIKMLDTGVYTVEIVNINAPNLVLFSRPVTINVSPPTLMNCPNDIVTNTLTNDCTQVVNWTEPTAIDIAGNNINYSFRSHTPGNIFQKDTTNVKYVFCTPPDTLVCQFNVIVEDNQLPVFGYFPNDTIVYLNTNTCQQVVSWNPPTFSDNCPNPMLLVSHPSESSFSKGTTMVTYTLSDSTENTTQQSFNIVVIDTIDPTVTYFPNDTIVYADANCGVVVSWSNPIFYDNCDPNPTMSTTSPSPGNTFLVGITTIEYSFSDFDGNETERTFTITVLDTIPPTIINCPTDTIFSCESQVFWTIPTATDNCTPTTQISIINPIYIPGDNFPVGTTSLQYIFSDTSGNTKTCDVVIYVYPPITSTTSNTMVSCNEGNDGTATVFPTNGQSPFTYQWNTSPLQTTATATNLTSGNYEVTITDANGCTSTETITVNEPTALFTTITIDNNIICNGGNDGAATITATGGTPPFTYLWDNGETTASSTQLNVGWHFSTVTDANNCIKIDSVNISEPAAITSTLVIDSLSCNSLLGQPNDGKIIVTPLGGTTPYSYEWTNNVATTDTADNLAIGTYGVTITDVNGCSTTNTGIIQEPPILFVNVTINQPVDCNGGATGMVTASVFGGTTPYSYNWSNGATASTVSNFTSGNQSVFITDNKGCMIGSTFNIPQYPKIDKDSIQSKDITCTNASGVSTNDGTGAIYVSSGTLPYSYLWDNGNTTPTITNLDAGKHFVTVTDATGCFLIDSVMIAAPPPFIVNTNTFSDTCGFNLGHIQTAITGGTFGYTYNWSTGQTSPDLNNIPNGNYDLTVTDANSCTEMVNNITVGNTCDSCSLFTPISFITANQFEYTCIENGQAQVLITIQGGKPTFDGFSNYTLTLTGSTVNGENGTYSDPSGIFSFIVNNGDNWNILITDDLNCSVVSLDELYQESFNACPNFCDLYPLTMTISNDTIILLGDEVPLSLTGGISYNWFPSNTLSCNDCANPIAIPNETTTYTAVLTDINGCTATDTVNIITTIVPDPNIFVKYNTGITGNQDGINDNLVFENLHLYPKNELVVFNRYGNIVYQASPYHNEWNGTYQGLPLPEGVYYFILRTDLNNTETLRGSVTIVK